MANKKITELTSATTPLAGTEEIAIVQSGETKKVAISEVGGGGGGTNKQIFHWWGGNLTTPTLNRYYYISHNGLALEYLPGATDLTTITQSMQGRNKGLFIAPFDCKIKRVLFKEGGSGSYTGTFSLASGLPFYDFTSNIAYAPKNWAPYTKHDYAIFNPTHTWIEFLNQVLEKMILKQNNPFSIFFSRESNTNQQ